MTPTTYLESTNGQDEIRRLDNALHLGGMRAGAGVYATKSLVLLIDSTLAHGRDKHGELRLVDQIVDLGEHTVSNGASVHENDGVLGAAQVLEHDVDDIVLLLRRIGRLGEVNGRLEALSLNLGLHHVGGQHDVHGPRADVALAQRMVNLVGNVSRVVELGDVARDLGAHVGKDIEVAVS